MSRIEQNVAIVRPRTQILRDPMIAEPYTQEILAAILQEAGVVNVAILDEMATGDVTHNILSQYDTICISADTPSYPRAKSIMEMCHEIKRSASGNIKTIIGGPHPSALSETVLGDGWDIVCKGEGDLIIEELIQSNQPGIVQGQRVRNLDAIPLPAREMIDGKSYGKERNKSNKPTASILTSRGCPNSCIYCYKGVFGNIVFYRSVDNILQELQDIKKRGIESEVYPVY